MYRDRSVAVVIPAHNEELHVGGVIDDIPSFVDLVVVVDDASTDGTAEIVRASTRRNVELIGRTINGGMGSAIVAGFGRALARGADLIAVMDADGQMDSSQLPRLLDPIIDGKTDFAKGNRFFSRDSFAGMPRNRVFGNLVLTFLTKLATGFWHMFDSENGYTAISSGMLRRLPLERLETGYQFANRLLIELSSAGARVVDVPIPARYGEETSGIHVVRDGLAIVGALFTGFWARVFGEYFRPGLTLGGVVLTASMMLLAAVATISVALSVSGAPWLGFALAGLGVVLGCLALFFVLDSRRKRPGPADEIRRVISLNLPSGSQERSEDQRELAHREHP